MVNNLILFFQYADINFQDDDSMDKDGNDMDGECSRPQKHAKSPELAREFLLDAATVIFKEQVAPDNCHALLKHSLYFSVDAPSQLFYYLFFSFLSSLTSPKCFQFKGLRGWKRKGREEKVKEGGKL